MGAHQRLLAASNRRWHLWASLRRKHALKAGVSVWSHERGRVLVYGVLLSSHQWGGLHRRRRRSRLILFSFWGSRVWCAHLGYTPWRTT